MMRKTPQTSFGLESAKDDYWLIPSLPFVWSPLVQPTNGGDIPDTLPFELGVGGDLNPRLLAALRVQQLNDAALQVGGPLPKLHRKTLVAVMQKVWPVN